MNGMFWILNSGATWRDLPERGNWKTVYDRFRSYKRNGMFERIVERLHLQLDKDGYIDWQLWAVDSAVIRTHNSAAGAAKKRDRAKPAYQALGRSRGGFLTKFIWLPVEIIIHWLWL
jgi:transposase